ncbi:translation elongation factor P (EF-P) [Photobacterium leiognathi subsp. mandapamensis]|nr:translation elongation factor P (EF-P) [Photobacterium leiognathi subsp. mandapamensis]
MFNIYKPSVVKYALNLWPPFWGSGIKIVSISDDFRFVKITLKLRWWNKNANRTQYGGSIFSLTDPVYSLMLMGILGQQYFIWDKQASINFIQPGDSDLTADFVISEQCIDAIKQATEYGDKYFPSFTVNVLNNKGELVSQVQRTLYVRKKPEYRKNREIEEQMSESSLGNEI